MFLLSLFFNERTSAIGTAFTASSAITVTADCFDYRTIKAKPRVVTADCFAFRTIKAKLRVFTGENFSFRISITAGYRSFVLVF